MWFMLGFIYFKYFSNYKIFLALQHLEKFATVRSKILSVISEIHHIQVCYDKGLPQSILN
jgi:hypothetical protein